MVDIKAIQEVIDYLASHEGAQNYIIPAGKLRDEKQKLEKAIQGAVPYNCDMLEEHITGGGEHANIEERLCCLEAAAGLSHGKVKALESFQEFADNALRDLMGLNASEQKSEVITSTITIPDGIQITPTTMKCDRCNAPLGFNAYSSGAMPGKTFCGPECAWKAEVEQRLDRIEEAPMHGETCPNCSGTGIIRYTVGCAGHKETKEYQCIRCGGKGMI